jgi:hypothetical protein
VTWQNPYGNQGPGPYGPDQYGQGPGWQNTQPGWQDPYAAPGTYGQGYGPPGARPGGGSNGATVGALVANIICAVLCCGTIAWLPGVILAAVAMNRNNTDPESARRLTIWSWVCFGISLVLGGALLAVMAALGAFDTSVASAP